MVLRTATKDENVPRPRTLIMETESGQNSWSPLAQNVRSRLMISGGVAREP